MVDHSPAYRTGCYSFAFQSFNMTTLLFQVYLKYRVADKSLARPGRKQATTEDFEFHISYL